MVTAEEVRFFINDHYIEPARQRGAYEVRIVSGDIHTSMNLSSRMPLVCEVLRGEKLRAFCNISLKEEKRKPNVKNNSSTNLFIFDLIECGPVKSKRNEPFFSPRGSSEPKRADVGKIYARSSDPHSNQGSAKFISKIILENLQSNNFKEAFHFSLSLKDHTNGEIRILVEDLISQIQSRIEYGCSEVPEELIDLAGKINHRILY